MDCTENIYEDLAGTDLGENIVKLEKANQALQQHIEKLEGDITRLCSELSKMKEIQQNLTRNISELFKTAKAEIVRKDRMISDLRQQLDDLLFRRQTRAQPEPPVNASLKRQRHDSPSHTDNDMKRHRHGHDNPHHSDSEMRRQRSDNNRRKQRSRSRSRDRSHSSRSHTKSGGNRHNSRDRNRYHRSRSRETKNKVSRDSRECSDKNGKPFVLVKENIKKEDGAKNFNIKNEKQMEVIILDDNVEYNVESGNIKALTDFTTVENILPKSEIVIKDEIDVVDNVESGNFKALSDFTTVENILPKSEMVIKDEIDVVDNVESGNFKALTDFTTVGNILPKSEIVIKDEFDVVDTSEQNDIKPTITQEASNIAAIVESSNKTFDGDVTASSDTSMNSSLNARKTVRRRRCVQIQIVD